MMKVRLLFFILLLPILVRAQGSSVDKDDIIEWNANRKLNWNDFQGKVPKRSEDAALSNCAFGYSSNSVNRYEKATFIITVQFHRDQSWAHPNKRSIQLLQHEQRHFDLVEVYARKFRQRLSKGTWTGADLKRADKIYQALFDELSEMQHKYDKETMHGLNTDKQHDWNEKIGKELDELAQFASK